MNGLVYAAVKGFTFYILLIPEAKSECERRPNKRWIDIVNLKLREFTLTNLCVLIHHVNSSHYFYMAWLLFTVLTRELTFWFSAAEIVTQ